MRFVGIQRSGSGVGVAWLYDDGAQVTVVAGLENFRADAAGVVSWAPGEEAVQATGVEFVPPVLSGGAGRLHRA